MGKDILIISSEFPPMPGGIGNHAFMLAKELTNLNYAVTVLTELREQNEGDWQKFVSSNRKIRILGIRRRFVTLVTYCQRFLKAYSLIRKHHWGAVVYSGRFPVWLNGILPRTKSIVVIHGSEIKQRRFSKLLFYSGLKKASRIVCVSDFTRGQLLANYPGIENDKVSVVNNGIRNDWIAGRPDEKRLRDGEIALVTVGGIHRRKGQSNVVRALPRILQVFPNAIYHVVGLPVDKDRLLELINGQKLDRHVMFHHGLSDREVRDLLEHAHVFMMLSDHLKNGDFEGFGIAIVEAMALGLPAIGTRNSGIADAIREGYSGRLVDPKNPDEVTEALRAILDDYVQYSANARESAGLAQWKYRITEYQRLIDQL